MKESNPHAQAPQEVDQKQERGFKNDAQNKNLAHGVRAEAIEPQEIDAPSRGERARGYTEDSKKQPKAGQRPGEDEFFSSTNYGGATGISDFNFGDWPSLQNSLPKQNNLTGGKAQESKPSTN